MELSLSENIFFPNSCCILHQSTGCELLMQLSIFRGKFSSFGTQLILCKLGKETTRKWGEAGKKPFSFFLFYPAHASRGFAARRLLKALRNARKTLGKERDCSQSTIFWTRDNLPATRDTCRLDHHYFGFVIFSSTQLTQTETRNVSRSPRANAT